MSGPLGGGFFLTHTVYFNKKPSCRQDSRPYCLTSPLGSRDVIGHVTNW